MIRAAILVGAALLALSLWWAAGWIERKPLEPSGGLWWPVRQTLEVPHFSQGDERWGGDFLGPTQETLAEAGCAVAAAAMVLAFHGVDTDPGRLNDFLRRQPQGYTDRGWIYWEAAPLVDERAAARLLPHYEDLPSHALLDWNLIRGEPSIVRLRYPNGVTHFVVVAGKEGFDYLMLDPAPGSGPEWRPLREFGSPVEALRFYRAGNGGDEGLAPAAGR